MSTLPALNIASSLAAVEATGTISMPVASRNGSYTVRFLTSSNTPPGVRTVNRCAACARRDQIIGAASGTAAAAMSRRRRVGRTSKVIVLLLSRSSAAQHLARQSGQQLGPGRGHQHGFAERYAAGRCVHVKDHVRLDHPVGRGVKDSGEVTRVRARVGVKAQGVAGDVVVAFPQAALQYAIAQNGIYITGARPRPHRRNLAILDGGKPFAGVDQFGI